MFFFIHVININNVSAEPTHTTHNTPFIFTPPPSPLRYSSVTLSSTGDFRFDVVPPNVLTGALLLPLPSAGPLERLFRCFRLRLAFSFTIALNF